MKIFLGIIGFAFVVGIPALIYYQVRRLDAWWNEVVNSAGWRD